jgi:NADH dehydrogenase
MSQEKHKIVIVGGGAGGLELAARLGREFGPEHIVLVDKDDSHIWKPSLHEVAAGTLDIHREDLSYFMLARDCGFTFMRGELHSLDRAARQLGLKAVLTPSGEEVFPARTLRYDTLVMAVGSKSNFFGTPGAAEHAIALDSTGQAEHFRQRLLNELVTLNRRKTGAVAEQPEAESGQALLNIAIVGGGATGVELAAELLEAFAGLVYYGLQELDPARDIKITLLEGADRILSALPPKLSETAQRLLTDRGVDVRTSVRVAAVEHNCLVDAQGNRYPATLCVWAAGIEAPAFLSQLGLEANRVYVPKMPTFSPLATVRRRPGRASSAPCPRGHKLRTSKHPSCARLCAPASRARPSPKTISVSATTARSCLLGIHGVSAA